MDKLRHNRPTVGAALAALLSPFLLELFGWLLSLLPAGIPAGVITTGQALGAFLVVMAGAAIGAQVQRSTWAENTHKAAVAYAMFLDPAQHQEGLAQLGIDPYEAADLIGADPELLEAA